MTLKGCVGGARARAGARSGPRRCGRRQLGEGGGRESGGSGSTRPLTRRSTRAGSLPAASSRVAKGAHRPGGCEDERLEEDAAAPLLGGGGARRRRRPSAAAPSGGERREAAARTRISPGAPAAVRTRRATARREQRARGKRRVPPRHPSDFMARSSPIVEDAGARRTGQTPTFLALMSGGGVVPGTGVPGGEGEARAPVAALRVDLDPPAAASRVSVRRSWERRRAPEEPRHRRWALRRPSPAPSRHRERRRPTALSEEAVRRHFAGTLAGAAARPSRRVVVARRARGGASIGDGSPRRHASRGVSGG